MLRRAALRRCQPPCGGRRTAGAAPTEFVFVEVLEHVRKLTSVARSYATTVRLLGPIEAVSAVNGAVQMADPLEDFLAPPAVEGSATPLEDGWVVGRFADAKGANRATVCGALAANGWRLEHSNVAPVEKEWLLHAMTFTKPVA